MEHNDFDEKIKNLLSKPPLEQPSPQEMEQFQSKLRRTKEDPRWRAWWPLLLALPILLGMADLYMQNKKLSQQVATFETFGHKILVYDTLVNKTVVYQVDTVFRTIYLEKRALQRQPILLSGLAGNDRRPFTRPLSIGSSFSLSASSYPLFSVFPSETYPLDDQLHLLQKKGEPGEPNSYQSIKAILEGPFTMLNQADNQAVASSKGTSRPNYYPLPFTPESLQNRNLASHFKPSNVAIGGYLAPIVLPKSSGEASGLLSALEIAVEYPGARRLSLGIEWLNTETEIKEAADLANFEQPTPNNPTDILKELKVSRAFLQIPLMVQQGFFISPSVEANVGLGLVAYQQRKQASQYEFLGINEEYGQTMESPKGSLSVNAMRYKIGANVVLGSRFEIEPQIQFQHGLKTLEGELFHHQYWSFGLGGSYKLK